MAKRPENALDVSNGSQGIEALKEALDCYQQLILFAMNSHKHESLCATCTTHDGRDFQRSCSNSPTLGRKAPRRFDANSTKCTVGVAEGQRIRTRSNNKQGNE